LAENFGPREGDEVFEGQPAGYYALLRAVSNIPEQELQAALVGERPSQPRQFVVTIAVRSWWYAVSVKAESVEEHKESGIILDLTRCGQRLNNRAAILQSK